MSLAEWPELCPVNEGDTDSPTSSEAGELLGHGRLEAEEDYVCPYTRRPEDTDFNPSGCEPNLLCMIRRGNPLPQGRSPHTHPEVVRGNWHVEEWGRESMVQNGQTSGPYREWPRSSASASWRGAHKEWLAGTGGPPRAATPPAGVTWRARRSSGPLPPVAEAWEEQRRRIQADYEGMVKAQGSDYAALFQEPENEGLSSIDMLAMAAMVEDDQPSLASTAKKRVPPPAAKPRRAPPPGVAPPRAPPPPPPPPPAPAPAQRYAQWHPNPPLPPPPPAAWLKTPQKGQTPRLVELPRSCVLPARMIDKAREACGNLPILELEKVARAMWEREGQSQSQS